MLGRNVRSEPGRTSAEYLVAGFRRAGYPYAGLIFQDEARTKCTGVFVVSDFQRGHAPIVSWDTVQAALQKYFLTDMQLN